ncbi:MAG: pitrilysin family protein [Candidatus Kapaibacteriales bacterium]
MQKNKITYSNNTVFDINEELDTFTFGITLDAGSRKDPIGKHGMAHLVEHMSLKGFKGLGSLAFARKMEILGLEYNAFTTKEVVHYYIRGLVKVYRKGVRLLLKSILTPNYTEKGLLKEKQVINEEIDSYLEDFEEQIFEISDSFIFEQQSYSKSILGTKETLENIGLDDLNGFHKNWYQCRAILAVSGGLSSSDMEWTKNTLNAYGLNEKLSNYDGDEIQLKSRAIEVLSNKSAQNSHILMSRFIFLEEQDFRFHLALLNIILSDGMSSKLFWQIREKLNITYNIYSTYTFVGKYLIFQVYSSLAQKNLKKCINAIEKICIDLGRNIKEVELQRAKTQLKTQMAIEEENSLGRVQAFTKDMMIFGNPTLLKDDLSLIDGISLDDILDIGDKLSKAVPNWVIIKKGS